MSSTLAKRITEARQSDEPIDVEATAQEYVAKIEEAVRRHLPKR